MRAWLRLIERISLRNDEGQDLLEYALLVALIAIVAAAAVGTVGATIYNVFWRTIAASV